MSDPKVTGHNVEGWHRATVNGPAYQDDEVTGKDPLAVFDELIPTGSDFQKPKFTSVAFNEALAAQNRLELSARVDDFVGELESRAVYIFVETSADGRHWIQRSNQTNAFDVADADITLDVGTDPAGYGFWSDACVGQSRTNVASLSNGPLLRYARLRVFFDATDFGAHVRIYAHGAHRKAGARS